MESQPSEPTFNVHEANEQKNPFLDPELLADKRRYRRILTRIITVMLIIIFAILLFWLYLILKDTLFYTQPSGKDPSTARVSTSTTAPTPTPPPSPYETSQDDIFKATTTNWKVYINEDLGISFKYPEEWVMGAPERTINPLLEVHQKIDDYQEEGLLVLSENNFNFITYLQKTQEADVFIPEETGSCMEDPVYIDSLTIQNKFVDKYQIRINGGGPYCPSPPFIRLEYITLNLNNKVYYLYYGFPFVKDYYMSQNVTSLTFTQILSTFKFLDETSPTPTPRPVESESESSTLCGGIAALSCPTGFACRLDGTYPDASGTCIPN